MLISSGMMFWGLILLWLGGFKIKGSSGSMWCLRFKDYGSKGKAAGKRGVDGDVITRTKLHIFAHSCTFLHFPALSCSFFRLYVCFTSVYKYSQKRTVYSGKNNRCFLKNIGRFRKNIGRFWKNFGRFRKNIGRFWKNFGRFWWVLWMGKWEEKMR